MTVRMLRAELLRLRTDYVLLAFVAIVLVITVASLVTQTMTVEETLIQITVVATFFGAIRYGFEHRCGLLARAVLIGHRAPTLIAKSLVMVLCGTVLGVAGGAATLVASGGAVRVAALCGTVVATAAGAVWGLHFGILVRNYFLGPAVVFAVHIASGLVLNTWPDIGRVLPLGGAMSLLYPSRNDLLPVELGALVYMAWLAVLGAITWAAVSLRDVE